MSNIYDILEYGYILAKDEDRGWLVTASSLTGHVILNLWTPTGPGEWANTDIRTIDGVGHDERGRIPPVVRAADEWIAELVDGGDE